MVSLEQVYLAAHTTPIENRESGMRCHFIRINEQWGMKFYTEESMRNKTHAFQARAAEAGLAPRVGECFELRLPLYHEDESTEVFGYVTECISETFAERMASQIYDCSFEECLESEQDEISDMLYDDYAYKKLIEGIENIGISTYDIHYCNVGYLREMLVCIDFSEEEEM